MEKSDWEPEPEKQYLWRSEDGITFDALLDVIRRALPRDGGREQQISNCFLKEWVKDLFVLAEHAV